MEKQRVDVLLVNQGLFDTREKAKRAVMAGVVLGKNEERLDKPGVKFSRYKITFKREGYALCEPRWLLKLAKALKHQHSADGKVVWILAHHQVVLRCYASKRGPAMGY